ncbi:MAG: EhaD family protein [Methanobrevibacter sp.]
MNFLGFFNITTVALALMFIGSIGMLIVKKPIDKVILYSIVDAGFLLAVVTFKYLDVAFAIAILGPVSTIIFLMSILKIDRIRHNNQEGGPNV